MSLSKVIELLVLLDGYSKAGWLAGWLGIKVTIVIALALLEPIKNLATGRNRLRENAIG